MTKTLKFCDDALGLVTAYDRHMSERRSSLSSMEAAYRHRSAQALQAVSSRFSNMVAIFRQQQEQLKKFGQVLQAEKRKTTEATSQTERLKSILKDQTKELKRAKANSSSLANTIVDKNMKLKKWQRSYRLLEQEVADLHSERLDRASDDPDRWGDTDVVIRVHPHEPPQPTTEEEDDEEDLGPTIPPLTDAQMFAIEQSRGLISREAAARSARQTTATTTTATVSQVSPTRVVPDTVAESEQDAASRLKRLEEQVAAMSTAGLIPVPPPLPPPRNPIWCGSRPHQGCCLLH